MLDVFKSEIQTLIALSAIATLLMCGHSFAGVEADCKMDGTQTEMNLCAGKHLHQATAQMEKLYKEQLSHLETSDSKRQFEDSQKAWVAYSGSACLYENSAYEGGSIQPMEQAMCLESFTKERLQHLKEYIECREDGCPL